MTQLIVLSVSPPGSVSAIPSEPVWSVAAGWFVAGARGCFRTLRLRCAGAALLGGERGGQTRGGRERGLSSDGLFEQQHSGVSRGSSGRFRPLAQEAHRDLEGARTARFRRYLAFQRATLRIGVPGYWRPASDFGGYAASPEAEIRPALDRGDDDLPTRGVSHVDEKSAAGVRSLTDDPNNCGTCGHACALPHVATNGCAASACTVVTCATGYADCDGVASNGCEVNLNTSLTNCGTCGTKCTAQANESATCSSGTCAFPCTAGFADCDKNPANGCETAITTTSNCGACGTACAANQTCTGGTCNNCPTNCAAPTQCQTMGACGACAAVNAPDGTTCNDGNACTQTDTCQSGTCTGGNAVACTASDQCHTAGVGPTSGTCSNPAIANGTACNDNNACTQTDTCQAGTCTGANPVSCTAMDQCHSPGTCNASTGACSNPTLANGTSCNDSNACTQTDTCQAGTCTGANPVSCTARTSAIPQALAIPPPEPARIRPSQMELPATTATPVLRPIRAKRAPAQGPPVSCTAMDQCHSPGTCNPSTGACSNPTLANGTSCNDGNACTQTDTCQAGTCTGANPVSCTAMDQCHSPGTCNTSTGACSNPTLANGTSCNDGNACTQTDTCQAGVCTGAGAVTCNAIDSCHLAGTCNMATGCSNPTAPDGTTCGTNQSCTAGACGCAAGYANCGTGATGCQTDTQTDPNNCNACGTVCPPNSEGGAGVCNGGVCM